MKTAVITHFLYKERKNLFTISLLLIFLFIFTLIFDDIFKYMVVNDMQRETLYLLLAKWILVFMVIFIIGKMIIKSFRDWLNIFSQPLSKDEKTLLEKDSFMSAGDAILARKSNEINT